MKARHTATCEVCGGSFKAKRRDARICSPKCRQRARRAGQDGPVTDNRTDDAPGPVVPIPAPISLATVAPQRGRCGFCGMALDPGRDCFSIGAPVDGMHPECASWVVSGRRHLLLEPALWGGSPAMAAA